MVKSFNFSKNGVFYYDLDKKTIGRFPTNSNLEPHGSDNSLYFGMISNIESSNIFCKIFDVDKIEKVSGKSFYMKCGYDDVNVICNINNHGQIQIKLAKDGTMYRLISNYAFDEMKEFDFTKMLIVIDFIKKEVRFKNPEDFDL